MTVTLAELDARVAALEADRVDRRALMTTVNALSRQTRERLDLIDGKVDAVRSELGGKIDTLGVKLDDTNNRVRSLEESVAEIKDLLIRSLDGR